VIATKIMQFCLYKILEEKGYLTMRLDTIFGNVRKTLMENKLRKVERLIRSPEDIPFFQWPAGKGTVADREGCAAN